MVFYSNQEKNIYFNIPVFLFSLIPFFLITGPFLSDLSVSLISLIFLTYCIKRKNFSYFKKKYFYFFLIFWSYLMLNSLINNFNLDSLKISFFYFRYSVFVIAIVTFLNEDNRFIKYFFYCIFFCFIALILDGFYQYIFRENILGWKTNYNYRISSFFGDELILGSYLTRLWPIFFGLSLLILNSKKKLFYILILIFIFSEALIFLSGERVAFFYINLTAIFIILFSKKLFRIRLFTLTMSILLIVVVSFINPSSKERIIDQSLSQMNLSIGNKIESEQKYIFSKQHTHHYITAYRMFLDNKLLGVGVKNFRNFCNYEKYKESKLSCSTHPHNTYVQILSELGLTGGLFLIFVIYYFFKYIIIHLYLRFKNRQYFSDFKICILSGIIIYLWPLAPTGNFFNNWLNIIMILNLPFLIYEEKYHEISSKFKIE